MSLCITPAQRAVLQHTLGYGHHTEAPGWRNNFATEPAADQWQDVQHLVELGLMVEHPGRRYGELHVFHATAAGKAAAGAEIGVIVLGDRPIHDASRPGRPLPLCGRPPVQGWRGPLYGAPTCADCIEAGRARAALEAIAARQDAEEAGRSA